MYEHSALVYICVNIYMQLCLRYFHIYIYLNPHSFTSIQRYISIYIFISKSTNMHTNMPIYRSTYTYVYIYIYILFVSIYIYRYTYTYLQTYTYVNSFETFAKEYPFNYFEIHKYTDIYIYLFIYLCAYICIHIDAYIYIYICIFFF